DLLPLHQFAFGLGGAAFSLAGLLGYLGQLRLGDGGLAGEYRLWLANVRYPADSKPFVGMSPWRAVAALLNSSLANHAVAEQRFRNAVHDQIGVAADGRSEVGIGGSGGARVPVHQPGP